MTVKGTNGRKHIYRGGSGKEGVRNPRSLGGTLNRGFLAHVAKRKIGAMYRGVKQH
jgi:hypothetical protein